MSVKYITYCGPYVECKVQKTRKTFSALICSNSTCKHHTVNPYASPGKFCKDCGSPIQEIDVEEEVDAVDWIDLQEDLGSLSQAFGSFERELSDQGLHIWIGHVGGRNHGKVSRNGDESLTELHPSDIEAELTRFSQIHAKELDQLRAAYDSTNVTVKWGIVDFAN
jgi:hypothetical protein